MLSAIDPLSRSDWIEPLIFHCINGQMHSILPEFITLVGIHLLAVATPGPDFAVVFRQSGRYGRKMAIITAIGIGLGILLHMTYTLLGIGLLISRSAVAFTAMKYTGAAWLIFLGAQGLHAKPSVPITNQPDIKPTSSENREDTWQKALWIGFLTNGLNPKVTLFFLAIFTAVVSRETSLWVQAGYGLYLSLATMAWFSLISVVFGHPSVRDWLLKAGIWLERLTGAVLVGFGLRLTLAF